MGYHELRANASDKPLTIAGTLAVSFLRSNGARSSISLCWWVARVLVKTRDLGLVGGPQRHTERGTWESISLLNVLLPLGNLILEFVHMSALS